MCLNSELLIKYSLIYTVSYQTDKERLLSKIKNTVNVGCVYRLFSVVLKL